MPTGPSVGEVVAANGQVSAEFDGESRALTSGDPIFENDTLITSKGSNLEVKFLDGTVMAQGASSRMAVDTYVFDPQSPGESNFLFDMAKGSFRMATGQIADDNPDGVQMKSPLATIGIRGTTTVHQVLPISETHGAENLTGGRSMLLTDGFGNTQVVVVPNLVADFNPGQPMGGLRPMTPGEQSQFQQMAPLTSLGEPPAPPPADDAPQEGGDDGTDGEGADGEGADGEGVDGEGADGEGVDGEGVGPEGEVGQAAGDAGEAGPAGAGEIGQGGDAPEGGEDGGGNQDGDGGFGGEDLGGGGFNFGGGISGANSNFGVDPNEANDLLSAFGFGFSVGENEEEGSGSGGVNEIIGGGDGDEGDDEGEGEGEGEGDDDYYSVVDDAAEALDDLLDSLEGGDVPAADPGELIEGTSNPEVLSGTQYDDTIFGFCGDDTISGGGGDNILWGGNNGMKGDFADYSGTATPIKAYLQGPLDASTVIHAGGTDTLYEVENVIGTDGDDTIVFEHNDVDNGAMGGAGDDSLVSYDNGDDDMVIYMDKTTDFTFDLVNNIATDGQETDYVEGFHGVIGGAGDDSFIGQDGSFNFFMGGLGDDTFFGADYENATINGDQYDGVGYTLSTQVIWAILGEDTQMVGGNTVVRGYAYGEGEDLLYGISDLEGSTRNDTLIGNNTASGAQHDSFSPGEGSDYVISPHGSASVDYEGVESGVTVHLDVGTFGADTIFDSTYGQTYTVVGSTAYGTTSGDGFTDTLVGITDIQGTDYGDSLYGNAGDNQLVGNGGDNYLSGGGGYDVANFEDSAIGLIASINGIQAIVAHSTGVDTLVGISGVWGTDHADSLEYTGDGEGSPELRGRGGDDTLSASDTDMDGTVLYGDYGEYDHEEVPHGNDLLTGQSMADTIYGGGGDDTIAGGGGDDLIYGNDTWGSYAQDDNAISGDAGNDIVYGGAGADSIDGGLGADEIHGGDDLDELYGGAGNDCLYGDAGDDSLDGGFDSDSLFGGDGNDTIIASAGWDTVYGDAGNDYIVFQSDLESAADYVNGGAGTDTLSYVDYGTTSELNTTTGIEYVIATGAPVEVTTIDALVGATETLTFDGTGLTSAEAAKFIGSAELDGHFMLKGGDGNDTFLGGALADTVYGGNGDDSIAGGAADDWIDAGLGNDSVDGGDGNDTIDGCAGNDTIDGGLGSDLIMDNTGADSILGGDGNDTIHSYLDGDTIDGGANDDFISFSHHTAGVNYDLDTATDITGIEGIIGSDYGDTLMATSANETLYGGSGDDSLGGMDGDDTLYGGDGADAIFGGLGNDSIFGEAGDDRLMGDEGDDTLYGGMGEDWLQGNAGSDTLYGGEGQDAFDFAEAGANDWDNIMDFNRTEGDAIHLEINQDVFGANVTSLGTKLHTRLGVVLEGDNFGGRQILLGASGVGIGSSINANNTMTAAGQANYVILGFGTTDHKLYAFNVQDTNGAVAGGMNIQSTHTIAQLNITNFTALDAGDSTYLSAYDITLV